MSTYDKVKAEFGAGPAYASRKDFTKIWGYRKGESLGLFDNTDDAAAKGATATEKYFDEEGYKTAVLAYSDHQKAIAAEWNKRVRAEYPEVNDAVFALAMGLADERGHSAGYGEVELYLTDYIDFAVKVIKASA